MLQLSKQVNDLQAETASLWAAIAKLEDQTDDLGTDIAGKLSVADANAERATSQLAIQKLDASVLDLQSAVRALEDVGGTCTAFIVVNGKVDEPLELLAGVHAVTKCKKGYYLEGDSDRQCGSGGEWNSDAPLCKPCPDKCTACGAGGKCTECDGATALDADGKCASPRLGTSAKTPAPSCKAIKDKFQDAKSGKYFIITHEDTQGGLEVYCDMDVDGGGWLGVVNIVAQDDSTVSLKNAFPLQNSVEKTISKAWREGVTPSVRAGSIGQLMSYGAKQGGAKYSEIRFRCERKSDSHVVDIASTSPLEFFTGGLKSTAVPDACDGTRTLPGDTGSTLGKNCKFWGTKKESRKTVAHTSTWGIGHYSVPSADSRVYDNPILIYGTAESTGNPEAPSGPEARWSLDFRHGRFECDDISKDHEYLKGDTWQIFVR